MVEEYSPDLSGVKQLLAEGLYWEALGFAPVTTAAPAVPQVRIRIAKLMSQFSQQGDNEGLRLAGEAQRHLLSGKEPYSDYVIARGIWDGLHPRLGSTVDQPVLDIKEEDISRASTWKKSFSPQFGSPDGDMSARTKKALTDMFRTVAIDLHKSAEQKAKSDALPTELAVLVVDKVIFCFRIAREYAGPSDTAHIDRNLGTATEELEGLLQQAHSEGKSVARWPSGGHEEWIRQAVIPAPAHTGVGQDAWQPPVTAAAYPAAAQPQQTGDSMGRKATVCGRVVMSAGIGLLILSLIAACLLLFSPDRISHFTELLASSKGAHEGLTKALSYLVAIGLLIAMAVSASKIVSLGSQMSKSTPSSEGDQQG